MGKIRRRDHCPKCGSLNVIKWGVRAGHQRYKCKDCQSLFTPTRSDVSANNRFVWFRKWISGKQRIEDIAKESGYSSRQLRRWFEDVTVRFGLGSIGEEVYDITSKHLEVQLSQIEDEIAALQKQNSNRESLVDDILSTSCHLDTLWQQGDYRTKQRLQKLVFPDGLIYDRTTSAPRTVSEHPAFAAFRSISNEYRTAYHAKAENFKGAGWPFEPRSGEGASQRARRRPGWSEAESVGREPRG